MYSIYMICILQFAMLSVSLSAVIVLMYLSVKGLRTTWLSIFWNRKAKNKI